VARGVAAGLSAVNTELIGLYWWVGRTIGGRRAAHGWGEKVIELQLGYRITASAPPGRAEFLRGLPDIGVTPGRDRARSSDVNDLPEPARTNLTDLTTHGRV
jgi:hypothetical protein